MRLTPAQRKRVDAVTDRFLESEAERIGVEVGLIKHHKSEVRRPIFLHRVYVGFVLQTSSGWYPVEYVDGLTRARVTSEPKNTAIQAAFELPAIKAARSGQNT